MSDGYTYTTLSAHPGEPVKSMPGSEYAEPRTAGRN
jgi:hypothetical protein